MNLLPYPICKVIGTLAAYKNSTGTGFVDY